MSVIDVNANFACLTMCWFPKVVNCARLQLTAQEFQQVEDWIDKHVFDAAVAQHNGRMNVTVATRRFIPNSPDWTGSALQPLYDKTGEDPVYAARLYGNLVCHVGIRRKETWWCFPEPVADGRFSRTYILVGRLPVLF